MEQRINMKRWIKLIYTIIMFSNFNVLMTQEIINKHEYIKNFLLDKDSPPSVKIVLEFKEDFQLPIDLQKEEIQIEELKQNVSEKITPKEIQILDTYNVEKELPIKRKEKIYSLLIDSTLSLKEKDFEKLKSFAENFIKQKQQNDLIAIYSINGSSKKVQNFTSNQKKLLSKLEEIKLKGKKTKIYDALYESLHDLYKFSKKRKEDAGGVILFTDGKEETSILSTKDVEDLIIYGTKFDIPIYFVIAGTGSKNTQTILEKISLKTGGKVFYNEFDPQLILLKDQLASSSEDFFIKKLKIIYDTNYKNLLFNLGDRVQTKLYIKNTEVLNFQYPLANQYLVILYFLLGIIIIIIITFIIYKILQKKYKEKLLQQNKQEKNKIDFPEPEIGEVFADLRQYKDEPQKKYIESEEKPDIPLIAKNWIEPSYAPYLDDPLVRKKFSDETMTLSLKEKSYIVLQMALKEAPKYNHGALVKKDREGLGYDKKFDIFLDEVYIGSSSAAHIPLRDSSVSHIHAKIKRIDNKFILFDLMSVAGTYLNGKKVLRPMPLRHNDEIRMGHTIFRFIGEN